MSNTRGNRKTLQIVIHGLAQHTPRVAWMMHRTAVGGRRRAAPTIADRRADMPAGANGPIPTFASRCRERRANVGIKGPLATIRF